MPAKNQACNRILEEGNERLEELDQALEGLVMADGGTIKDDGSEDRELPRGDPNARYLELMERQKQELQAAHREYQQVLDQHIDTLETQTELLEDIKSGHGSVLQDQIDRFERIEERHDQIERENERLRDDHYRYEEVLDRYMEFVEEVKDQSWQDAAYRAAGGAILTTIGLISAQAYYDTDNALDFYSNAPEIAAEEPVVGFLTVGLPVLGAYLFKKAYDKYSTYDDMDDELRDLKSRRKKHRKRERF